MFPARNRPTDAQINALQEASVNGRLRNSERTLNNDLFTDTTNNTTSSNYDESWKDPKKPLMGPKPGSKRTGSDAVLPERDNAVAVSDENTGDSDDSLGSLEGQPIDKNCNQVRRLIHNFLDAGEMNTSEFTDAIGVSSNSYYRFMGQTGPSNGIESNTYQNAWAFFKKREMKGISMPRKKRKTSDGDNENNKNKQGGSGANSKSKSNGKNDATEADLSSIHLEGEETDSVPVYDSCQEIRRKITAHLKKPNVTSASFCRALHAQFHSDNAPKRLTSSQLETFRSRKGPEEGNTSSVFYSAYVYFEKLRLKEQKPKSKHREKMEEIWGPEGFDTKKTMNQKGLTLRVGESLRTDQYGRRAIGGGPFEAVRW